MVVPVCEGCKASYCTMHQLAEIQQAILMIRLLLIQQFLKTRQQTQQRPHQRQKRRHAYLFANQQTLDNASPIGSPVLMEVVFHRVDGNLLTCFGMRGGDFLNVAGAICMLTAKEGRTSNQRGVQTRDRNCVMLGMPQQPQQPQPLSIYVLSISSSLETCSINFVLTK